MYKVYLLKKTRSGTEVMKGLSTETPSAAAATAAFWDLRHQPDLQGQPILLLMTKDKEKLNRHWFNREPGDEQYVLPGEELREA
ncbi:hypothetical protein VSS37_03840 [Candidatus Thiothrix sp. Deng01]|uniref:Uncharacterized protein n=1 Tax=Candidatus Thiothrix phosphatis TaxID=3112415 RepID=A0ABU6CVM5_9GAMM|nr:hypothetical protein [Candidatus Thiothrix sp. Deng01]MEB4590103.1 hypothetical protein [Candidatus Thiothrix sp. Deng01]